MAKSTKYVRTDILSVSINRFQGRAIRTVIGVNEDNTKILVRDPQGLVWYSMSNVTVVNKIRSSN
mgnify:CR=1 FL=1